MPSTGFWERARTPAAFGMMILMAVFNLLLIRQNLGLRAELDKQRPKLLQPGDRAGAFAAPGLKGDIVSVDYAGRGPKRVFLYFSPDCPYCRDQFGFWRELLSKADENRFEVLGLVSDGEDKNKVGEYLRSFGCDSLRTALAPNAVLRNYKLGATPTTLVVDNTGKVEHAWAGAWDTKGLREASSAFGFSFQRN